MPTMKKMLLRNYHIVGSRERDLANFKVLRIYLKFISEISLVISLHDWFTFIGAFTAVKNCILTRSKVGSRKVQPASLCA